MTAESILGSYRIGDPGRAALEVPPGLPGGCAAMSDIAASAASVTGVQIRAAAVRGVRNLAQSRPRQDAFGLGHRRDAEREQAIAVVCGGVATCGQPEEAARLASRHLTGLAAAGVPWPAAFADASRVVSAHLAAALLAGREPGEAGPARAGGTAAAGLIVHRDAGAWIGTAAWAGNCSIWHLTDAGQWIALPSDQASGQGTGRRKLPPPLPSAQGACATASLTITGGALFLMTSGVASPLKWSKHVQQTLADWWATPPDPFTFAAQASFARKSHVDDRTIVGLWPDHAGGRVP